MAHPREGICAGRQKPDVCRCAACKKKHISSTTVSTSTVPTNACGDGGGLAAVVCSLGNWYNTALVISDSVTSQLLHRDDAQINFLEMLVVVLLVETFGDGSATDFVDTVAGLFRVFL